MTLGKAAGVPPALPVSRAEVAEIPRGLVVLLAEDNEVNQELAIAILERRGCHVVLARDGREAVALWESEPFDLVLMDVQMPDMDGLRATQAIRAIERTRGGVHTPIVAVTAHAMEGDRERCLAAGMDGYVSKPLRVGELFQVVAALLPQRETQTIAAMPTSSRVVPAPIGAALEAAGGDAVLLERLALVFLEQCPLLVAKLRDAIQAGDGAAAAAAAHALGGSLAVLAAPRALGGRPTRRAACGRRRPTRPRSRTARRSSRSSKESCGRWRSFRGRRGWPGRPENNCRLQIAD